MTIREIRTKLTEILAPHVGDAEAGAMASTIIEDVKGYKAIDVALYGHRELLPDTEQKMLGIAQRVADGEPLQYALGKAYFRGRMFAVTPATLIPRPETAGLVDMAVDRLKSRRDCRILDIGTGSGCIAISMALDLPFAEVVAVDISDGALDVARANAKALKAKVQFVHADALHLDDGPLAGLTFDAIISNPPYVLVSERKSMDSRVTDHEPPTALFVPDSQPLLFYRAIGQYAAKALAPGGWLFFEINPLCASNLADMLRGQGFDNIDILPDYKGNLRYALAQAPQK